MSWFADVSSPETITAITTGIAAIITAIGLIIAKFRKNKKIDFESCKKIYEKSSELISYIKRLKNGDSKKGK